MFISTRLPRTEFGVFVSVFVLVFLSVFASVFVSPPWPETSENRVGDEMGGGRVIARPPKQLTTMTSSIGKAALQPLYFNPCICCGSTLYLPYIHTSMHLILLYCFTLYEFYPFF